jgi:TRAP transporter 4TM/12TM fusion protein
MMSQTNKSPETFTDADMLPKMRSLSGWVAKLISLVAIAMSLFHVYTAIFGVFESYLQRSVHLGFAMVLTFLIYKPRQNTATSKIPWYDVLITSALMISFGYLILTADEIVTRFSFVTPLTMPQMVVGAVLGLALLEATRRTVGWALTIIVTIGYLYAYFGANLPGMLGHRDFSLMWIMDNQFFTTSGVFGIPLGVSATFIFLFVLFGKFLEVSGAGQFFIDLAVSLMGKYRGGPAKTAIVASSIMGTISGSAVANTVTTGAFTIPMMKRTGYRPEFAAAVEAVASSGGQIMPPIMGASAFIVASYVGVPYIEIAIAAIIPAVIFYLCLYFQVDFRAMRRGLRGLPPEEIPKFANVLVKGFLFFTPLILIVWLLSIGYSPMRAGLFAIVSVIVVAMLKSTTRISFRTFWMAMDLGARSMLETAIATAAAGMVIGLVTLTGIGLRFSSLILDIGGGNLLFTLILTAITSIILGMGLPTVAAYIVQVALTVPALIALGVPPIAAHLFIFYFAAISAITPPVALAAFAGAGIAKSDPMKTGWVAMKLGIAAYIVPFMFIYGPSLLLMGTPTEIITTVITASIGIYAMAAAVEGWLLREAFWYERLILTGGALCLIKPGLVTDGIGIGSVLLVFILHKMIKPNKDAKEMYSAKIG